MCDKFPKSSYTETFEIQRQFPCTTSLSMIASKYNRCQFQVKVYLRVSSFQVGAHLFYSICAYHMVIMAFLAYGNSRVLSFVVLIMQTQTRNGILWLMEPGTPQISPVQQKRCRPFPRCDFPNFTVNHSYDITFSFSSS